MRRLGLARQYPSSQYVQQPYKLQRLLAWTGMGAGLIILLPNPMEQTIRCDSPDLPYKLICRLAVRFLLSKLDFEHL